MTASPEGAAVAAEAAPDISTRRRRRSDAGAQMRARIVDSALQSLLREGYANTSARTIAATGDFSPALVFYHFGSVDALLLAALDHVSTERLSRYRRRLGGVLTVGELAAGMHELYLEDQHDGYLTAVQEIVGGMAFDRRLGAEIVRRMQPWVDFAESLAGGILATSPLRGLIDPSVVGTAAIALYMGLEIVARMRGGDAGGSEALMATLTQAAPFIDALIGARRRPRAHRPARVTLQ